MPIGVFDFKRRCTEWSVYDIKVPREKFESIVHLLSYRTHDTFMSYTDHSAQRRLKSNIMSLRSERISVHLPFSYDDTQHLFIISIKMVEKNMITSGHQLLRA